MPLFEALMLSKPPGTVIHCWGNRLRKRKSSFWLATAPPLLVSDNTSWVEDKWAKAFKFPSRPWTKRERESWSPGSFKGMPWPRGPQTTNPAAPTEGLRRAEKPSLLWGTYIQTMAGAFGFPVNSHLLPTLWGQGIRTGGGHGKSHCPDLSPR